MLTRWVADDGCIDILWAWRLPIHALVRTRWDALPI